MRKHIFEAPLTIGVISDTHLYHGSRRALSPKVLSLYQRFGVGLILHAGDINVASVLDELGEIAPVLAVQGNNDEVVLQERLPMSLEILVAGKRIGLTHGHGGRSAREVAIQRFAGTYDLGIFGHSHLPLLEEKDGTILFNPGSALDRRSSPHFGVGIVRVLADVLIPELILFESADQLDGVHPENR